MKISYNWLKEFAPFDLDAEKAAEILTDLGLEIEGMETWESVRGGLRGVVIGKVLTCIPHPNSDHLHITTVDLGQDQPVQIVCGAPNVAAGQTVAVATVGAVLYDKDGSEFRIKESKLRGEVSRGMICAEDELGLGDGHDGIMVLSDDIPAGTPAAEVFAVETDTVFEIGLTPNRADAMSHLGVARDLAARLNYAGSDLRIALPERSMEKGSGYPVTVTVEDPARAPRYCGVVIKGVKVAPSPAWLANRLKAVGVNSINNVVDITNYVLQSLGQPLHAFDLRQVGDRILVKTCAEGTPFVTLDGVERKLSAEDLAICSADGPMCLAGVYGGLDSGVKDDTTDLFIESAYFDPVSIRRTSKRHGLQTDASFRYERGIDPNITMDALQLAIRLLCTVAGGTVASDITDICPDPSVKAPFSVNLRYEHIAKLLGKGIAPEDIKAILVALEIKTVAETPETLQVEVPAYRVDVQREADVIEDILRVYGYNNIEVGETLHTAIVADDKRSPERLFNITGDLLAARGYYEIMSNSLTRSAYVELTEEIDPATTVRLLNPLSADLDALRQNLLFCTLEAVARNISFRRADLRLFELGKTYHRFGEKYVEQTHLAMAVTGKAEEESWRAAQRPADYYDLRADFDYLMARLGIGDLRTRPAESDLWAEAAEILSGKTPLARIGRVSRRILKAFDIAQPVYYCDVLWENVLDLARKTTVSCRDLPKYPSVRRDLALLVDQEVTYQQLHEAAFAAERSILRSVNLFDVYQGKNLPEGKKSYALSFTLADAEKTLDEKRIETAMRKLMNAFEKQFGASLRA